MIKQRSPKPYIILLNASLIHIRNKAKIIKMCSHECCLNINSTAAQRTLLKNPPEALANNPEAKTQHLLLMQSVALVFRTDARVLKWHSKNSINKLVVSGASGPLADCALPFSDSESDFCFTRKYC